MPRQGELIDYIPTWHHGLCMMRFLPHRDASSKPPRKAANQYRRLQVLEPGIPVLQASAGGGIRPEQAAVRDRATAPTCAAASSTTSTRLPDEYELRGVQRKAAEETDQRRQGRPGQRTRRTACRSGRASAAGADVAARDLLDEPPARTAGDGGGAGETLRGLRAGAEGWGSGSIERTR